MRTPGKTPARSRKRPRANPAKTRAYRTGLVREAAAGNTLLMLSPCSARAVIGLAIAEYFKAMAKPAPAKSMEPELEPERKPVLVLTTRREEAKKIKRFLDRRKGLGVTHAITGDVYIDNREKMWNVFDIACATPEMFIGDQQEGMVSYDQFGLVVFAGAHRAVGKRACAVVARELSYDTRILAMTDTLPRRPYRGVEMMEALRIVRVAGRPEFGPDTASCRKPAVEWVVVDLLSEIAALRDRLRRIFHDACESLRDCGYGELEDPQLSHLGEILMVQHAGSPVEAIREAVYARCMLDLLEVFGMEEFLKFCEWCRSEPGISTWLDRPPLACAIAEAQRVQATSPDRRPKMDRLEEMLAAPGRALVVADSDDSVWYILRRLMAAGIPAARLWPGAGVIGVEYMKRTEAVDGLRTGRYRVLVSPSVEDACSGIGDDHLVPGDLDLVVCGADGADGADAAHTAVRYGAARAARVVILATRGSYEDPDVWAAARLDWRMAKEIEYNRRPDTLKRPRAGLAARPEDQPKYQLRPHKGEDAVLGPPGPGWTFVDAAGPGGTVRVLLGRAIGKKDDRVFYKAYHTRPAGTKPQRKTVRHAKTGAYALLKTLERPGRNADGKVHIKKCRALLSRTLSVEEYNTIMCMLRSTLDDTIPRKVLLRNWLIELIEEGSEGRDGKRLAMYATGDGELYNDLADMACPEGHMKIETYVFVHELPGGGSNMRRYVESLAETLTDELKHEPKFLEQARIHSLGRPARPKNRRDSRRAGRRRPRKRS